MARKKETDLGEITIDDLDFGDSYSDDSSDSMFAGMADKRKPIDHFVQSTKETVKERLTDKSLIKKFVTLALPKGYPQAFNAYDGLLQTAEGIYKDNESSLGPGLSKFSKSLKSNHPFLHNILPKFIKDAAEDKPSSSSDRGEDSLSLEIKGIDELFKLEASKQKRDEIRSAIESIQEQKKFKTSTAIQARMASDISSLVGYQDNILIKYHRKSLELQVRQLDVTTKLLAASTTHFNKAADFLEAIQINTALPDFVKMRSKEVLKQRIVSKIADAATNSAGGWASKYFQDLQKNASDMISGLLMVTDQVSLGEELGVSKAGMAGQMLGQLAGNKISDFAEFFLSDLAVRSKKAVEKVPGVVKTGDMLSKYLTGIPERLNTWAKSDTEGTDWKSIAIESVKSLLSRREDTQSFSSGGLDNLDAPAYMTNIFHKTVVDVIPSFLASMDKSLRTLSSGVEQEESAYSFYADQLVPRSTLNKQHMRIGLLDKQGSVVKSQLDSLINSMGGAEISEPARRALRKQLLRDMANSETLDVARYANFKTWSNLPEEVADELMDLFAGRFGVDMAGVTSDDKIYRDRYNESLVNYTDLQRRTKNYGGRMAALQNVISRRTWRELGLTAYDGFEGEVVKVDELYDLIANLEDTSSENPSVLETGPAVKLSKEEIMKKLKSIRGKKASNKTGLDDSLEVRTGTGGMLGRQTLDLNGANIHIDLPEILETSDEKTHSLLAKSIDKLDSIVEAINSLEVIGGYPGNGYPEEEEEEEEYADDPRRKTFKDHLKYGAQRGAGALKRAMAAGARGIYKGAKWYVKNAYKLMGKGLVASGKLTKFAYGQLFDPRKGLGYSDVYVAGDDKPAMTARKIRNGFYFDVNSQKVIDSIKDITGPVLDRDGNTVLTQEDFDKGLMNGDGESLAGWLTRGAIGAGLGLAKVTGWYAKKTYGLLGAGIKGMFNIAYDQFVQYDAYFPGDDTPRIRSKLMQRGFYRNADGSVISSLKDINGPVYDLDGNMIISQEEIDKYKSLYTVNGSLLFTFGRGVISFGKWAAGLAYGAGKWYLGKVKSMYKTLGKMAKGALKLPGRMIKAFTKGVYIGPGGPGSENGDILAEIGINQLKVQYSILDILQRKFDSSDRWDLDGDGDRENSWKDILSRRGTKSESKKRSGGNSDVVDAIERLEDTISSRFSSLEEVVEESAEDGVLDQAADLADIRDGTSGDGKRKRKGKASTGKKGIFRRLGGKLAAGGKWLLNAGKYALPFAAGALGAVASGAATVASAAGSVIAGAATAVAGAISAPVLIGAGIVAGIGALGYLGYKWLENQDARMFPILYLRMTQYGVNPSDKERITAILSLEKMVLPCVVLGADGTASIDQRNLNIDNVLSVFKINKEDSSRMEPFLKWVANRFRPILLNHVIAAKRFTGSTELSTLDEKVRSGDLVDYVTSVDAVGLGIAYNDLEASPFDDDLTEDASDVNDAIKWVKEKAKRANRDSRGGITKVNELISASAAGKDTPATVGVSYKGSVDVPAAIGAVKQLGSSITQESNNQAKKAITSIDIATAVRYKSYGLRTLDIDKCRNLYDLEEIYWELIEFNGTTAASVKKGDEVLENRAMSIFLPQTDQHRQDILFWLNNRFIPTLLQYAVSVRRVYNGPPKFASRNMTGDALKQVLEDTSRTFVEIPGQGKVSIWAVKQSPWLAYTLEYETGSVKMYIDSIPSNTGGTMAVSGMRSDTRHLNPDSEDYANKLIELSKGRNPQDLTSSGSILGDLRDRLMGRNRSLGRGGLPTAGTGDGSVLMNPSTMGMEVKHPGGGSSGDINSLPVPSGQGWGGMRELFLAAAKMTGFDAATAASVAAIESSFKSNAAAPTSSAKGLFQFTNGTWGEMIRKYGKAYGISPMASPFDPRANAVLGMKYLTDNYNFLKSRLNGKVTDTALYAAHFLGPGGAAKLFSADPNAPAYMAASADQIKANPSIFYSPNGSMRTVGQVIAVLDSKMKSARSMHDLSPGETTTSQPSNKTPSDMPATTTAGGSELDSTVGLPGTGSGGEDALYKAANGPASGVTSATTSFSPDNLLVKTPQEQQTETQTTPAVATQTARDIQNSNVADMAKTSERIAPILQQQLSTLLSMDQSLRGIYELLKKNGGVQGGNTTPAPAQPMMVSRNQEPMQSRNPVSASRPKAVT